MTINSTSSFLQTINESAYLIFTPNLTQAYKYLAEAKSIYPTEPSVAVFYADQSRNSAAKAYSDMRGYKNNSLAAIVALTGITAVILYKLSRPVVHRRRQKG